MASKIEGKKTGGESEAIWLLKKRRKTELARVKRIDGPLKRGAQL